ncbi:hypothetical protein [Anaerolinea sp.]|uniref:hypothetical protein n=1 Tax=Anaerolinea sp. TaxID=1872519 RepID=UPI002ACE9397|nr:hypothetical protein [Anaerolinea sp.]
MGRRLTILFSDEDINSVESILEESREVSQEEISEATDFVFQVLEEEAKEILLTHVEEALENILDFYRSSKHER